MSSKLIRLTTSDENCIFDAQYDEDIVLDVNSSIALQSASFKTADVIIIDAIDNRIDFQAGGTSHTQFLKTGQYSVSNIRDLLTDIQDKMNQASSLANPKEFGLQYAVNFNQNHKVQFRALQNQQVSLSNQTSYLAGVVESRNMNNIVQENDVITALNDPNPLDININHAIAYGVTPFTRGCGVHRMRIKNMEATASNGFMIGLTKNLAALRGQTMALADIECAIQLTDRSSNYQVKETALGFFRPTTATTNAISDDGPGPEGNDVVEIAFETGIIKLRLHTSVGGGTLTELGQYTYDYETKPDLYPFICLYRNDTNIGVDSHNMDLDPYTLSPASSLAHALPGLSTPQFPNTGASVNFKLQVYNDDLSESLGFASNVIYDITATELLPGVAVGSNRTFYLVGAENYLVELLNFPLRSYDSFYDPGSSGNKRGRANIIACIPVNELTGSAATLGVVQYEPNTPHFIGLDNKEERLIRNIRARIVRADYQEIESIGLSAITLLLKTN